MAFWVIFPLAALIVLSGWVMILISAARKLRSQKDREGNDSTSHPSHEPCNPPQDTDPVPLQPNWTPADRIATDGTPAVLIP
jgi:hypothetical protein